MKHEVNVSEEGCLNLIGAIVGCAKEDFYYCPVRVGLLKKRKVNYLKKVEALKAETSVNRLEVIKMNNLATTAQSNINILSSSIREKIICSWSLIISK